MEYYEFSQGKFGKVRDFQIKNAVATLTVYGKGKKLAFNVFRSVEGLCKEVSIFTFLNADNRSISTTENKFIIALYNGKWSLLDELCIL